MPWVEIAGGILVAVAVLLLWHKVTEVRLGEQASRFLGAALAAFAYFYATHYHWSGVRIWLQGLVFLTLGLSALVFAVRGWRSKQNEFLAAVRSSRWLMATIGLFVAASFLFQGEWPW